METILLIATNSILNIVCFFIGAKVRQKVDKGEKLELPNLNPVDIYHEHKEKEEAKAEMDKLEKILNNMDKYDGTSAHQEDIE